MVLWHHQEFQAKTPIHVVGVFALTRSKLRESVHRRGWEGEDAFPLLSARHNIGILDDEFLAEVRNLPECNLTGDWSARESVRARLCLMVRRILRKYMYPSDRQEGAVEPVLKQVPGEVWMALRGAKPGRRAVEEYRLLNSLSLF